MAQTFVAVDQATQTGTTVMGHLTDQATTLRSSFSGSSAPGSPVDGQLWLDTSATPHILKCYADLGGGGSAWQEIASIVHSNVNFSNYQATNFRLENTASHTTPASGVIGEPYLHTGTSKAWIVTSASKREVVLSGFSTDYISIWLPVKAWDWDATNPPTAATIGTTPTIRGAQFDATNEKMSIAVPVPAGYSGDADLKLRVWAYLLSAETDNDTIDATIDLVSVAPDAEEVPTGTSTQATVAESIGTGNTQYSLHKFDFTLDYNDATNPIAAGDLLEMEFALSSVASVSGIIVRGAQLLVPLGTKITE
jgi:hypothetical protein